MWTPHWRRAYSHRPNLLRSNPGKWTTISHCFIYLVHVTIDREYKSPSRLPPRLVKVHLLFPCQTYRTTAQHCFHHFTPAAFIGRRHYRFFQVRPFREPFFPGLYRSRSLTSRVKRPAETQGRRLWAAHVGRLVVEKWSAILASHQGCDEQYPIARFFYFGWVFAHQKPKVGFYYFAFFLTCLII